MTIITAIICSFKFWIASPSPNRLFAVLDVMNIVQFFKIMNFDIFQTQIQLEKFYIFDLYMILWGGGGGGLELRYNTTTFKQNERK